MNWTTERGFTAAEGLIRAEITHSLEPYGAGWASERVCDYVRQKLDHPSHTFVSLHNHVPIAVAGFRALEWDSSIYGMSIASLSICGLDQMVAVNGEGEAATRMLARTVASDVFEKAHAVFICRIPLRHFAWVRAFEELGFRLADVQSPLALPGALQGMNGLNDPAVAIRELRPDDLEAVEAFGTSVFVRSHLYADDRLPRAHTDHLHRMWVRNDCTGRAEFVLVAEVDGRISGFIACLSDRLERETLAFRRAHIDLLATAEPHRRRGIGRALVSAAVSRVRRDDWNVTVTVSTQASNTGALRLYRKAGFETLEPEVTLHGWRDEFRDRP